ncbi:MAG: class II aldolase/adducin family protein [Pseudomonadales bacterium]
MKEQQLRQQLIDYALELNSSGLSLGRSGNLSVRSGEGFLITPTGINYQHLDTNDIVWLDNSGAVGAQALRQPSSEWHFHCGLYQSRPDINAIVHAHPDHCTALACTGRHIPAFHYMVAVAGGKEIPIAPYALFGTEALSNHVCNTLTTYQACLLANHGMIAVGTSLPQAFNMASEVETLARQYCETLKLGAVKILSAKQMDEVLKKFAHYGQRT